MTNATRCQPGRKRTDQSLPLLGCAVGHAAAIMVVNLDWRHAGPKTPGVGLPVFQAQSGCDSLRYLRPSSVGSRIARSLKLCGKAKKRFCSQTGAASNRVVVSPVNGINLVRVAVCGRLLVNTEWMLALQTLRRSFARAAVVHTRLLDLSDIANAKCVPHVSAGIVGEV